MPSKINVHSYKNYREFLKAYYEHQKSIHSKFSYREFSKRAGLHSPNYLQIVISGKRNLTVENIHQFARAMDLTFNELSYFEMLVLANQSKDPIQKDYYNQKVKSIRPKMGKGKARSSSLELLDHWFFPGIVAALAGRVEGVLTEEILRLTHLSGADLAPVLEQLQKNKIIFMVENRYFLKEDQFIFYFKNKVSNRFQRFQEAQLEQSKRALYSHSDKEAKFFSHAFTIEKQNLKMYHEKVRQFLEELSEQSNTDKPEKLMQLNIQLFGFQGK